MDQHLKVRLLDAAVAADAMYQRDMAKAISDGIAEIERLHVVLADLQKTSEHIAAQLESVLPLLRRLERPTEAMRAAMEGEPPYSVRTCDDGVSAEVLYQDPDTGEYSVAGKYNSFEVAADEYHRCRFYWQYSAMLQVASEQPTPRKLAALGTFVLP
jgi:hypothetical protein